ncbi:hypothetical protein Tco_0652288 [Tanacetum coccineum]|uniref:Uncharacterized protein n=1 Tax=Tanacetum coccineum TaxID=301880 RepID=A0ABQ4WX63_9ASTR
MKKMYCLVVTDDYSRFTWVFFLATKDETSGILKSLYELERNLIRFKGLSLKSSPDAGFKPLGDDEKKVTEEPRKECGDPITNEVNVVGVTTSIELLDDLNMPALEDIVYSDDDEDVGAEADMNNFDTTIQVSHIPTTRVRKDHPVKQVIGYLNSAP